MVRIEQEICTTCLTSSALWEARTALGLLASAFPTALACRSRILAVVGSVVLAMLPIV